MARKRRAVNATGRDQHCQFTLPSCPQLPPLKQINAPSVHPIASIATIWRQVDVMLLLSHSSGVRRMGRRYQRTVAMVWMEGNDVSCNGLGEVGRRRTQKTKVRIDQKTPTKRRTRASALLWAMRQKGRTVEIDGPVEQRKEKRPRARE
jgi:hypothetical protein